MSEQAMRILALIRSARGDFMRGYALGSINEAIYKIDAWESQYLQNVANRVIWERKSA